MSTFNGEKYLREQLDSIVAQDIAGLKLIVRDDNSTDSTAEILQEYADRGALTWYRGETTKTFSHITFKIGYNFWELCKNAPEAEYYAFADQDDIWLPNKLAAAVAMIEKNEVQEIPILYCSAYTAVDSNGNPTDAKKKKITEKSTRINRLIVENIATGCTCVFNERARGLFCRTDDFCDLHDFAMAKLAAAFGRVIYDQNSFIKYRNHDSNIVGAQAKHGLMKRFKKHAPNMRSLSAEKIIKDYGLDMDAKTKEIFATLAFYRKSFKKKLVLLFTNRIRFGGPRLNLLFKAAILFSKV
jgi:rhamnosyltransferase